MRSGVASFGALLRDATIPAYTRLAYFLIGAFPVAYMAGAAPADICASLIAALFLYDAWRRNNWTWCRATWVKIIAILWVYLVVRSLFAEEMDVALKRSLTWIRFPLFAAACAFWLLHHPQVRKQLLISLTLVVIFLIFDTLIQYNFGVELFGREVMPAHGGGTRLTGPFSAPKVGIVLAWLTFPVLAVFATARSKFHPHRQMIIGALFAILFLLVVFITGERMAFLLTLFGFALLALLNPAIRKQALALGLVAMLVLGLVTQYNPDLMARQYYSTVRNINDYQQSPYGLIWQSSLSIITSHPLTGIGPRHFRIVCPREEHGAMDNLDLRCNLHPHQLYLEWAVDAGLIGLSLFLLFLGAILKKLAVQYDSLRRNPVFVGLLIALILRIWPISTSTSFFVGWSALPFWLVVGWLLALCWLEQSKQQKRPDAC